MGLRGPGSARQALARQMAAPRSAVPLFDGWNPMPIVQVQPWDADGLTRAERVLTFIETLPCTKGFGAGEPIRLEPFQREWIEAIYAEGDDAQRNVRAGLLSVARGNGKTVQIGRAHV